MAQQSSAKMYYNKATGVCTPCTKGSLDTFYRKNCTGCSPGEPMMCKNKTCPMDQYLANCGGGAWGDEKGSCTACAACGKNQVRINCGNPNIVSPGTCVCKPGYFLNSNNECVNLIYGCS